MPLFICSNNYLLLCECSWPVPLDLVSFLLLFIHKVTKIVAEFLEKDFSKNNYLHFRWSSHNCIEIDFKVSKWIINTLCEEVDFISQRPNYCLSLSPWIIWVVFFALQTWTQPKWWWTSCSLCRDYCASSSNLPIMTDRLP